MQILSLIRASFPALDLPNRLVALPDFLQWKPSSGEAVETTTSVVDYCPIFCTCLFLFLYIYSCYHSKIVRLFVSLPHSTWRQHICVCTSPLELWLVSSPIFTTHDVKASFRWLYFSLCAVTWHLKCFPLIFTALWRESPSSPLRRNLLFPLGLNSIYFWKWPNPKGNRCPIFYRF
jgi:hypothetical protein